MDGDYYIASARGTDADWFKNIVANPNVHVQVRDREFDAVAEPVTDPLRIADFIELRLRRHPIMIRLIMHLFDGLPLRFTRADLETFLQKESDGGFAPKAGDMSSRDQGELKVQWSR